MNLTDHLATRADHVRGHMRDKTFYLGDPNVHRRLTWMATEYGDVLVKNYSSSTSTGSSTESSVSPIRRVVDSAVLSGIMQLTHEDFRLSSDGYWKEPTNTAPTMADVVLSCTGAAPDHDGLAVEFDNILANLNLLINEARNVHHRVNSCCIPSAITLEMKIKFCHLLFEERSQVPVDSDYESGNENKDESNEGKISKLDYGPVASLNIDNWPTNSEEAEAAIYAMRKTHRVLPLQAFDEGNKALHPLHYRRHLKGAVVQIFFKLTRFVSFRRNRNAPIDVFIAEIVAIRRLDSLHGESADNVDLPVYMTPNEDSADGVEQGKNKKIKLDVD